MSENISTNKELEEILVEEMDLSTKKNSEIIVFNDDFNTFDWVIQSLMDVCKHTFDQSEQLSILIHYKGKASVKTGNLSELQPMKDSLVDRGLSAVIETFQEV